MNELTQAFATAIADRYRILRKLGEGGMADVFIALDLRHDREVAIKVMRPELAVSLGVERFVREIRLLARLQHPHIVALVDSGEAAGVLFYVMPYFAEGSLRARLEREHELPLADALQILREIAGALEYAHAEGVLHRDIKPENVLLSSRHAQVADFGVARILGQDVSGTAITTAGVTVGTPRYMAPEQAAGDPNIDHRADVYAFGVLAYELIAGVPPFVAGSAAQVVAMHLGHEPEPLAKRRASTPAALSELVMRCLQKRPADRWQSARELLAALDRVATTDGAAARQSGGTGTVTSHLPITEAMVRRLDRDSFDPRLIGTSIEYLDNQRESDVLVLLLNAIWLDGSDLEPHLRALPYRCIAPTLPGFEPRAQHRMALRLRDHAILLSELLHSMVERCGPSLVITAGFSASADLLLILPTVVPEGARVPDGILGLGPNQGIETCFISRVVARFEGNDPLHLLASLRSISDVASTLDDWLLLNSYLGRIMARFRADVSPLRTVGRDIIEPFERDGPEAFAAMYRGATSRVRNVRCIFEDSEVCNRLLRSALVDHMDRRTLGPHHRDGSLLIEPTPSHFDLLQPERVARHLSAMIEELRATPR